MFSLIAIKARCTPPPPVPGFVPISLSSLEVSHFLPSKADICAMQNNLIVLVSRILCQYMQAFSQHKSSVAKHIPHVYSEEMARPSQVAVLDVLHKNETKSSDMVDIMRETVTYLGKTRKLTVLSGGDHVTCEREQACKRHVMCSNTPRAGWNNLSHVLKTGIVS